jgi:hypothetical protein
MPQEFASRTPGRRLLKRLAPVTALAALSLAVIPSPVAASVTIGSNLHRAPNTLAMGALPVTVAQAVLPTGSQASGGLVSPVRGTVTHGRVRVGSEVTPFAFRVIRSLGGSVFTGAATSAIFNVTPNGTFDFDLQLPIEIGDRIGLNCCAGSGWFFFAEGAGSTTMHIWGPVLADGDPGRAPDATIADYELVVNADIEPTSGFTIGTITRNKKKGTATITANVPNPGELTGSGNGVTVAKAAVISKTVTAPGNVQLKIKPTGKKKATLNETGKVKVKPKITYTPTGGSPSSQSVKLKLKKKL